MSPVPSAGRERWRATRLVPGSTKLSVYVRWPRDWYGLSGPQWLPGLVAQLDSGTDRLTRATYLPTAMSNGPSELAIAGGAVWSLNSFTSTLTRLGL